ncbi:GTPase-activating protein BEM2 [Spathaspora sp. JA1]|nr:GTPase-activating protein BEM2 [Spathaspora sp. JA1]
MDEIIERSSVLEQSSVMLEQSSVLEQQSVLSSQPGELPAIVSRVSLQMNQPKQLTSLIKSDYDYTAVKVGWVNVVINNSVTAANGGDINQARVFRAELKGSHLYLFKPSSNIKRFNLDDEIEEETAEAAAAAATAESEDSRLKLTLSPTNGSTRSVVPPPVTAPSNMTMFDSSMPTRYTLTHFTLAIHPNLQYDETSETFTSYKLSLEPICSTNVNSVEAILHYIVLYPSKDEQAMMFIELLPILPDFGSILTLLANMLLAIVNNKYQGDISLDHVIRRTLQILNNIEYNFSGYLLKSDIAPYILRIIELLTNNLEPEQLTNVDKFKQKMLYQQHKLIDLVNSSNKEAETFITGSTFLNLNVMELAQYIVDIDLRFYSQWNPTIDKSLLVQQQQLNTFYKKNPLVFNDNHIHYLSRLFITHILVEQHEDELKARIVEKWIDLTCLLEKLGDLNSWVGLTKIIISQPILRLTQIWNLVSPDYIKLIRNDWSPILFELEKKSNSQDQQESHVIAPRGLGKIYPKERIVAYFGDLAMEQTNRVVDVTTLNNQWNNIQYSLTRWHEYLSHVENNQHVLQYNQQILERYDNMGFIFSNESLNQVLNLGTEAEEEEEEDDEPERIKPVIELKPTRKLRHPELKTVLMKLIETNSNESMDIVQIMKLSEKIEPKSNECYVNDGEDLKTPSFNNKYFKINQINEDFEVVIEEDLVFSRIITGYETAEVQKKGEDVDIITHHKYIPKYGSIDKLIDLLVCDVGWNNKEIQLDLQEYRFVFLLNSHAFIKSHELLEKLIYKFNHVDSEVGNAKVMTIQINVLKVLILFINNFYHPNFTSDMLNHSLFTTFLHSVNSTIVSYYTTRVDDDLFDNLIMYYKRLKQIYVKKSYRPIEQSKFDIYLTQEFDFNNTLHDVPINRNLPGHSNMLKIEKFLIKFNKFLFGFYQGITMEDWMKVYRILETMYYKNELLNFNMQSSSCPEGQMIISNVITYLETLTDENNNLVINKFPVVFQKLFKLYIKFRTYLLIQLSNEEERFDRMKCLLIMVKIAHLKRTKFEFENSCSTIPSFIETAITSVIYSPLSRSYSHLWLEVARNGNNPTLNNIDDISKLFPKLEMYELNNHEPLLPCFGWIIENLLEINKIPSSNPTMINFNKRYSVYKLIKQVIIEDIPVSTKHDSREFDFLLRLNEHLPFTITNMGSSRLFYAVLRHQKRILHVDSQNKNMLTNGSKTVIQAVNKKGSTNSLKRQSLKPNGTLSTLSSNKFKLTGLFTRARPLQPRIISIKELPESTLDNCQYKKPLIIPLRNRKIFPIYHMRQCFKIENDSSQDSYLIQAISEDEVNDWLIKLDYANRHWFMSRTMNLTVKSLTFGIPLSYYGDECPPLLPTLFQIIEMGIDEVGIYRISCSTSELINMKSSIDKLGTIDTTIDTHTATSLVKSYFRELPDSIFPDEVITLLFETRQNITQEKLIAILSKLPKINYMTLSCLMKHLNMISSNQQVNKMTSSNLATVIAPALTESSHLPCLVNNFGFMNKIVDNLIEGYNEVFNEVYE